MSGTVYELLGKQEADWDGKAVRLVHFFVRGMVTAQGDTDGRMLGSHWEGRGITPRQILEAVECFRWGFAHPEASLARSFRGQCVCSPPCVCTGANSSASDVSQCFPVLLGLVGLSHPFVGLSLTLPVGSHAAWFASLEAFFVFLLCHGWVVAWLFNAR